MKHFIILCIAGIVTLGVMLVLYRPDLLEGIWLWLIGLVGPIIGSLQELTKPVKKFFKKLGIQSETDLNENQNVQNL